MSTKPLQPGNPYGGMGQAPPYSKLLYNTKIIYMYRLSKAPNQLGAHQKQLDVKCTYRRGLLAGVPIPAA